MSTPQETPDTPQNGAADSAESIKAGDILSRIQSDPDFAVDSFKKSQANGTRLAQKLKSLQPLEEIASRLDGGAAAAAQALYEHAAILNHPEVRNIADHYRRTGTLPTASAQKNDPSDDDEYVDPVDALRSDLSRFRSEFDEFRTSAQRDRGLIVQQTSKSHLQDLASKHADYWDVIQGPILEQLETLERTPQGREALANATRDTWENLAKIAIGDHLDEVLARRAQKRVQDKSELGTEPAPSTVTNGREAPVRERNEWRPGSARKLMEDIMRRDGRLR